MGANLNHPNVAQPENMKCDLWRYMSFAKFVSMVSSNKLHFGRCDLFEDNFEGSHPTQNVLDRKHNWQKKLTDAGDAEPEASAQFMSDSTANMHLRVRTRTYVSCWHQSEYESAAMWKLYSAEDPAIAIVTKYDLLANLLPDEVYLGQVKYIDYSEDRISEGNVFTPLLHKRLSFEHEKEIRALYLAPPAQTDDQLILENAYKRPKIWECDLDINELIQKVLVSPTAPTWTVDLVSNIASKYEVDASVNQSNLYENAVF